MKTFLADKWQFNAGFAPGQEKSIRADGIAFELDEEHRINLDVLLDRPGKVEDDGIVYNRFHLDSETGLAFGMGCDWWAEVWLNGEMLYTTFPGGNASSGFTADDHQLGGKGKPGENLLAIHVRRGMQTWFFALEEKDPEQADPCSALKMTGDLSKTIGPIKPMNAVNNGPIRGRNDQSRSNFELWKALKIPFARNHDAAFFASYGGEHTVDVHAVFPDFSADPDDPASYDFTMTDRYLQTILDGGTQVFYRLGSKIEHGVKKYGTKVPPDFRKWAVICEHIIRHFNEGWADGFRMNILYWEIWNEPDLDPDDAVNKRTWQGTEKEFHELYRTAACHLKKCFPQLKIGGPALSGKFLWMKRFLKAMNEGGVPLDFFSWHCYCTNPKGLAAAARKVRKELDENGYRDTESNLNEWNYVRDWGSGFCQTIQTIIGLKGAVFTAAVMCAGQNSPLDMLMYYDARPCVFNGIFDFYTLRPLKGYYTFLAWSKLAALGTQFEVDTRGKNGIYAVGATDGRGNAGILVCRYFEPDDLPGDLEISVAVEGLSMQGAKVFLLDESHDLADVPYRTDPDGSLKITLAANTLVYIECRSNRRFRTTSKISRELQKGN